MRNIILSMVAAVSLGTPVLADPIKENELLYPMQWDVCYFKNAPIMFKNLRQFLTSTNMMNCDIDYSIVVMSLTLSSDHLIRSE